MKKNFALTCIQQILRTRRKIIFVREGINQTEEISSLEVKKIYFLKVTNKSFKTKEFCFIIMFKQFLCSDSEINVSSSKNIFT